MTKRLFLLFILFCFLFQNESWGRRPAVPLMETPRDFASNNQTSLYSETNSERQSTKDSEKFIGIEFGAVGRGQTTKSDALGMQFLWGGRITAIFPIAAKLFVKPSLGYFARSESLAGVSISQTYFEAGASLTYSLIKRKGITWLCGLSQRLALTYSTISVLSSSGKTPSALLYRLGPTTGAIIDLGQNLKLLTDIELTFAVASPTKMYNGITVGIVFEL